MDFHKELLLQANSITLPKEKKEAEKLAGLAHLIETIKQQS